MATPAAATASTARAWSALNRRDRATSSRFTRRRCSGAATTAVIAIDSAARTTATTARTDQSVTSHQAPVATSAR